MATVIQTPGVETVATVADTDTLQFLEGSQTLSAGGDKSGLATGLASVQLAKTCLVQNTAADPLKCDLDVSSSSHLTDERRANRPWYFWPGGGSALAKIVRVLNGGMQNLIGGGRLEQAQLRSGIINAASAVRVDAVYQCGGAMNQAIHASTNTNTDIYCVRGTFNSERGFSGTCYAGPGSVMKFRRKDNSSGSMPTGGTLIVCGGKVEWGIGNITNLYLLDGEFDISAVPADCTITNLFIFSHMKRSSGVKLKGRNATVSITNTTVWADETTDLNL